VTYTRKGVHRLTIESHQDERETQTRRHYIRYSEDFKLVVLKWHYLNGMSEFYIAKGKSEETRVYKD